MTQDNYSSNYTLPPCIVILKDGILIKTDADFYNGGVEKRKGTKMARRRARSRGLVRRRWRCAGGGRGARLVPMRGYLLRQGQFLLFDLLKRLKLVLVCYFKAF